MFSRLFGARPKTGPSRVPAGCVVWAVGDIHGRADLADRLIQAIRADLGQSEAARRVIVFLGDHVDRGPDSRGVLDHLAEAVADPSLEVRLVQGNHEERMRAFMADASGGPAWCDYGGLETLASYGVSPPTMRGDVEGWAETAAALAAALPVSHHALLDRQEQSVEIGDYFFAHAGARPGVPLQAQTADDLMWIRQPFLDHPAAFEKVVVHGHTPTETVVSDHRRIGIDTGAYATNVLSAVRLEGDTRVLLQARGRGDQVAVTTGPLARGT